MEYVHPKIGEGVNGMEDYKKPFKELRLPYNGREVLCETGISLAEATACSVCSGAGCGSYAIVPGYIVKWKASKNESGLEISQVEPIADESVKREIARTIRENENISNIHFW
jgi:hypothetical protein